MSETFEKISAVLDGEVPPAVGEVDGFYLALKVREALDRKACPDAWMRIAVESSRSLFDELIAQATRLQAEVAALQQRLNVADQQNDELQSELTKARELLNEVTRGGYLPRHIEAIQRFLAHQSAPAAKDGE